MLRTALKLTLPIFFLMLFIAWLTNPDLDAFRNKATKRVATALESQGVAAQNPALMGIVELAVNQLSGERLSRSNYFFCSVFTVKLPSREYQYLGAFSTFVPLQDSDPLNDLLKQIP